jgi:hypothetical protein
MFLTVLAPSERYARERQRRHKKLTDWGRQMLLARWLPGRRIIGVTDSSFAAIELLNAVRRRVCMITRLRLDARLFDPPPHRHRGTMGRPRVVGRRRYSRSRAQKELATTGRDSSDHSPVVTHLGQSYSYTVHRKLSTFFPSHVSTKNIWSAEPHQKAAKMPI